MTARAGRRILMHATIAVAVAVSAAGCDAGGSTTVRTPAGRTPTGTPPLVAFANGTPDAEGTPYVSPDKAYSVVPPTGWDILPNAFFDVAEGRFPTDVFQSPENDSGLHPSINIAWQQTRADAATVDAYRDQRAAFVRTLVGQDVAAQPSMVAGLPAYEFSYVMVVRAAVGSQPALRGEVTDVIFLTGDCRWLITLTAPAGHSAQASSLLQSVLDSFKMVH